MCKRKGVSRGEETALHPKLLLRLDCVLVGDEAADSHGIVAQPSTPHHLAMAHERAGIPPETFRAELPTAEALSELTNELEDAILTLKQRRSDLRHRQGDGGGDADGEGVPKDGVDDLIASLDRLRLNTLVSKVAASLPE